MLATSTTDLSEAIKQASKGVVLVAVDKDIAVKICSGCKQAKPATADFFHRNGWQSHGLHPYCKDCRHKPGKKKRRPDTRSSATRVADPNKTCTSCEITKPKSEFGSESRNADGLHCYCRVCCSRITNERTQRRIRFDWAARLMGNIRIAYASFKRRKKVLTWAPYDLDKDALWDLLFIQDGKCHWTSIPMSLEELGRPWSISLDRIDCDRGYTKDNVVLTCLAANFARNDSSPEDMRAFIDMIRRS